MSFTHLALFKWKGGTTPTAVADVTSALTELAATASAVESYRCGPDVSRTDASYDYAVAGVFQSREAFLAYRDDPEHQRILNELIRPNLADRILVQLED